MSKRSNMSWVALSAAALLAFSVTACSSSSKTPAAAGGSSTPASATGSTTPSAPGSTGSTGSTVAASTPSTSASASAAESSSSSPSSSATPPAITNKKSDWVERSGFKLKVDIVTYPYQPPAGAFLKPGPNEEFLKLHLELANTAGQGTFSMMDFEVRDAANDQILPSIVASDDLPKDVKLDLLSLKPGEKQTGEVVFITPKDAKGLRLVFNGTLMARDGSGGFTSGPPPVIDLGV